MGPQRNRQTDAGVDAYGQRGAAGPVLASLTQDLASSLTREQIARLVRDGVMHTIPNAGVRLDRARTSNRGSREQCRS